MRMTASWSGRYGSTEYKVVARYFAPDGKLPLGPLCCPTKKITGARSKSTLTKNAPYKACSAFTRVAACTLALSPMRDTLIEGFSHFVSSMTAPIASGWSGCRVGLAPTGKRRLFTAHANNGLMHCSKLDFYSTAVRHFSAGRGATLNAWTFKGARPVPNESLTRT